jgi:hypothetical protein
LSAFTKDLQTRHIARAGAAPAGHDEGVGVKMARAGRYRRYAEQLVAPLPVFLTATRLSGCW